MARLTREMDWSVTSVGPLAEWSQKLRAAVEIMLDSRYPMLIWWGPDLIQLYNDAYTPVMGARHPWGLGKPAPVVWSEAWPTVGPLAEAVLRDGISTWNERLQIVMTRNGYPEEVYMTFSYSPIRDEDGGIAGLFCACTEETQRVLGERRLRALRDVADATAETKTSGEAGEAACSSLGTNPYDLPFALLYLLDADGRTATLAGLAGLAWDAPFTPARIDLTGSQPWPLAETVRIGRSVVLDDLVERFGPLPSQIWPEPVTRAVILPLTRPGHGALAGLLVAGTSPRLILDGAYHDFLGLLAGQVATAIANARAYEEERRRAEALAEVDRAKTAFFSNVSHEFRTPLTLMLGSLEESLARADELPANEVERVVLAHRNGKRLQKLVDTLLDFSRIEAGRADVSYEPTDLAALTADLASNFRSATERAGLSLVVAAEPLPQPVFVDRDMWEKVVLNLISNAFKFTHDGEIGVTVRPSADRRQAELAVSDSGIGIPAHELPCLFERFHRVEGARGRSIEGSGIGLALVQELVRIQGGTITVDSDVGRGSTFTVSVPFGTGHLPADRIGSARRSASTPSRADAYVAEVITWLTDGGASSASEAAAAGAGDGGRSSGRILLADDNADMRAYVARLLAAQGYAVEEVADGETALAAARQKAPDLILADVMMPGLDGFQLLAAIRADPGLRETPLVLLSARAGNEARAEGMEAGANDYLAKPFSARELVARVSANLTLERDQREALLRESEERLAAELRGTELLRGLAERLVPEESSRTFHEEILSAAMAITRSDAGTIQLYDPATHALVLLVTRGFPRAVTDHFRRVDADSRTACGIALRTNVRTYIDFDDETDEACRMHVEAGYRSAQATPLLSREGEPLGMLNTHWRDSRHRPSERELRFLDLLARQAADLMEARQVREALRESEARLAAAFESVPAGVAVVDMAGQVMVANSQYRGFLPSNVIPSRDPERAWRWRAWDEHGQAIGPQDFPGARALRGESVVPGQEMLHTDDKGREVWTQVATVPVREADGRITGVATVISDIDALKRGEAALRESERRFRALAETSPLGVGVSSTEGCIIYTNRAYEAIIGCEPGGLLGQPSTAVYYDPAERQAWLAAMKEKSPVSDHEVRFKRKDGSPVWVSINAAPIEFGGRRAIIGVVQDVTERKRAETALRESEERLRAVLDQAPLAVAFIGLSGEILFRNPVFDQLWGRPAHVTTAQTYSDVYEGYHLDGRRVASEEWPGGRALKGETVEDDVFEIVQQSGRRITCWFAGAPIRDDANRIVGGVVLFRDISEERRVQEALWTSEERLRQFGEASQDVLWIRDAETLQWQYLTPAFEAIYGLSRADALTDDNYRNWQDLILPEDREHAVASIQRVREGEHVTFEYRIRRPLDGEVRWLRNTDFPMLDADGQVVRIGGVGHDVTELKRVEGQQQVLIAELQHRTRNLLAVVRNVARRSIDPSPGRDEYDARLAALGRVQGFLSRSTAYSVPLADVVEAELQAAGDGASDKVETGGPPVELPGESVQAMALALHELATNAVKYGAITQPSGRLSVTWHIEAGDSDGRRLVIDWRESGVVMPDRPPARRGYGSELITRALPYQLLAKTALEFTHDGVHCRIALPASAFTRGEEMPP